MLGVVAAEIAKSLEVMGAAGEGSGEGEPRGVPVSPEFEKLFVLLERLNEGIGMLRVLLFVVVDLLTAIGVAALEGGVTAALLGVGGDRGKTP